MLCPMQRFCAAFRQKAVHLLTLLNCDCIAARHCCTAKHCNAQLTCRVAARGKQSAASEFVITLGISARAKGPAICIKRISEDNCVTCLVIVARFVRSTATVTKASCSDHVALVLGIVGMNHIAICLASSTIKWGSCMVDNGCLLKLSTAFQYAADNGPSSMHDGASCH